MRGFRLTHSGSRSVLNRRLLGVPCVAVSVYADDMESRHAMYAVLESGQTPDPLEYSLEIVEGTSWIGRLPPE
jgi:hypothetical protein